MKNMIKFFGVIAFVAVIGFSMAGCKEDETDPTPQTVTYTGTADGVTYTLKITENTARYTAQSGDSYELTVGAKKSTGTVEKNEGGKLTLKPSKGTDAFTATVNSSGITAMTGTITFDDGSPQPAPPTITPPAPPVTGNDPFAGTWTGKYKMDGVDYDLKYVAGNGTWLLYFNNSELSKGTYTFSGNTVSMKITHGWQEGKWTVYADMWPDFKNNNPETSQFTVTGNTSTANGVTMTKQ